MSRLIQQGDVLFFSEKKLPKKLTPVAPEGGLLIFAKGEKTGHHHSTKAKSGTVKLWTDENQQLWFENKGKSAVTVNHQEHGKVTLEPGIWKIGIVREVDPFAEEIHKVQD